MSADMNVIVFDSELVTVEEVMSYVTGFDVDYLISLPFEECLAVQDRHSELYNKVYLALHEDEDPDKAFQLKNLEDHFWVGQVSGLKASLSDDDPNKYIPSVVQHFANIYERQGGVVLLTESIIQELLTGFDLPSNSIYENDTENRGVTTKAEAAEFLNKYLGSWTFVDNW